MSRIHVAAIIASSALVLPAAPAFAQTIFGGANANANPTATEGRVLEGRVEMCQGAPGGSRVRQNCEPVEQKTLRAEAKLTNAAAVQSAPQCEATTLTEYSQRNNVARVAGTVSISNCLLGSAGAFNVVARVKDESGETKPIEFAETWQRGDAEDVTFNGDYPIGDNVELVNVRIRDLKCTCAEATAGEPTDAAPGETPAPN